MKVAVIGATGLVGKKMIELLDERHFPADDLILAASERSEGKTEWFKGKEHRIRSIGEALDSKPDIALFSAGSGPSRDWAERFTAAGTRVIDNSSAWRMEEGIPLIVPEVNGETLQPADRIIANPNCSTIQMVMVLAPLHRAFHIRRVVVSTYQAVTGSGYKAVAQLNAERNGEKTDSAYPHAIDLNCLPHCDDFHDNGYTKEEMKMVQESRKILSENDLPVTATAVRVPVTGGHSESVNIEFRNGFSLEEVRELLIKFPGVVVHDLPEKNQYPMPIRAVGRDEVFVGRIRRDPTVSNGLNVWIVADNLRKGAATNAVQIAELLVKKGILTA